MKWEDLKKELLKDEKLRKEYEKYDLAFEIGETVIDARVKGGVTQSELARLVGTKQPSIARLENGNTLPSLSFLERIARSLGTYLIAPRFAFLDEGARSRENRSDAVTISFHGSDSMHSTAVSFAGGTSHIHGTSGMSKNSPYFSAARFIGIDLYEGIGHSDETTNKRVKTEALMQQ